MWPHPCSATHAGHLPALITMSGLPSQQRATKKLKDQQEKNIAYFSEFFPPIWPFSTLFSLSHFSDKLYELRELNVSFYCHCHRFCCYCAALGFCFWLNFLLFGLFIVLVDFHVHCEHKNKASQNKC